MPSADAPPALITDSASGSFSGCEGFDGQTPGPAVGVGLLEGLCGTNGEARFGVWICAVGAGITESGKTALTADVCFSAFSWAGLTEATTNGNALPSVTCVAPRERSVWASGFTSARTTPARVLDRADRPAGLYRRRTQNLFICA